jgi:peptidoglycan/LPS O-acetylase OafA/YrhL
MTKRLDFLEGLRAVTALYVVFFHAWRHLEWPSGLARTLTSWVRFGHYAVDVFVVISGFCLMLPLVSRGAHMANTVFSYYAKRAWRILPPYYLALAVTLALHALVIGDPCGTFWDRSTRPTAAGVVSHVLMLQNVHGAPQVNHAFWSIAVEFQLYLLFPLLLIGWRARGPVAFTALATLGSYPLYLLTRGTGLASLHPHYIGLFAMGMLAAWVARRPEWQAARDRWPWGRVAGGLALAIWLGCEATENIPGCWALADPLVGLASAALLVHLCAPAGERLARGLSRRPLVALGTFSYSLYLVHAPLLEVVWRGLVAPLGLGVEASLLMLMAVGVPLVVGMSWVFFLACEKPFLAQPRAAAPVVAVRSRARVSHA